LQKPGLGAPVFGPLDRCTYVHDERLEYRASLDGLRGAAVIAVLLFHQGFGWAKGGFLGVSLFFTLSGFLITSLVLAEHGRTGGVGLKNFWARRIRRLLPGSLLALGFALFVVAVVFPVGDQAKAIGDIRAALFNVANWRFIMRHVTYHDLVSLPSPVEHYWSLAIEEQFYLVFPLLAALTLRRSRRTLTIALSGIVAVSLLQQLRLHDHNRIYFGSDTRASEIAIGALLALAYPTLRTAIRARRWFADALGWVTLSATVVLWFVTRQSAPPLYQGGLVAISLLSAAVLLGALEGPSLNRALSFRPLSALGRISYGVYLFHFPLYLLLSKERVGMSGGGLFLLRFAVTIAMATVSFNLVELPIRRQLPAIRRIAPAALALGVITIVATSLAIPGPRSAVAARAAGVDIVESPSLSSSPTPTTPPAADATSATTIAAGAAAARAKAHTPRAVAARRAPRIVVVGDSTARANGKGLAQWGEQTGRLQVSSVFQNGCALAQGALWRVRDGFVGPPPNCDNLFASAVAEANKIDADAIVVFIGSPQMVDWMFTGVPGWHGLGEPIVDDPYQAALRVKAPQLAASRVPVLWASVPLPNWYLEGWEVRPGVPPPGQGPSTINNPDRTRRINEIDASILPTIPGVRRFAYAEKLSNPDGTVDTSIRPDGLHNSPEGVARIADAWLFDMLAGAYRSALGDGLTAKGVNAWSA
jgi:peptidoglycan/LPS O-acetylase OafA/YrhL